MIHKFLGLTKRGRALRIRVHGRTYTYVEGRRGKLFHELRRPGAKVSMSRSSWKNPQYLRGTCSGQVDAMDVALAVLLEAVWSRNLSLWGSWITMPRRFIQDLANTT